MALNWYVLRTEPRAEYLAADELRQDGLEVYLPLVGGPHKRPGHVDAPLFPGYLFLRCDLEADGGPPLRQAHRVLGWIKFGGEVPAIPDEVMSELTSRIEITNQQGGLWRRFRVGERVRIVSKSLETFAEIVEEPKSPRARVKVLLSFMGRIIAGEVPWEDLHPVDDNWTEQQRAPRRTRGNGRWINGFGPRPVPST